MSPEWVAECCKENVLVKTDRFEIQKPVTVTATSAIPPSSSSSSSTSSSTTATTARHGEDDEVVVVEDKSTRLSGQSATKYIVQQPFNTNTNLNADICDALTRILIGPLAHDKMRQLSYRKAIAAIKSYPHRITTGKEAASIPGIGASISRTIEEFLKTGRSRREDNVMEETVVRKLFEGIYGKLVSTLSLSPAYSHLSYT